MSADLPAAPPPASQIPLARRRLIRGSVVLAGAAGATVVGAALAPATAQAADGDALLLGAANTEASGTTLTISPGDSPALTLNNATGPSLRLQALQDDFDGTLAVGDIVNTTVGPLIGLDYGDGVETVPLATAADLDFIPTPTAVTSTRLLDTSTTDGQENIVKTSSSTALDGGRLVSGQWLDVAIAPAVGDLNISAVFANFTVAGSSAKGYLVAYPPGQRPTPASTLNYAAGQTITNGSFVAVQTVKGYHAVRIWVSATTRVILDLTGYVLTGTPVQTAAGAARTAGRRRVQRQAKVAERIRASLHAVR